MAIIFPSSPTIGQTYTVGNTLYTWNGITWRASTITLIDSIGDVDTSTTPPATNQVLLWNGTNWIPGNVSGIKYGTLAVLKGKLDLAILTGGPVAIGAGLAAIGVGVALKAAGGAIGAAANKNRNTDNRSVPTPQTSAAISTSAAGSAQDFGGGRVVFEISGTNLIGVLNRAGAKLTRFG
jgi:hypothetical protein